MTFEEWWLSQPIDIRRMGPSMASIEAAWRAATAAERDACAKLCEGKSQGLLKISESPLMTDAGRELHFTMHVASMNCATSIRARNATPPQD